MTNIKALGELLRAVKKGKAVAFPSGEAYYDAIDECMDEIEREVSERFMPLPCDAEGVPIHVGDKMEREGQQFIVCAIAPAVIHSRAAGRKLGEGLTTVGYRPEDCRHVKPRTLEDVLAAFAAELHSDRIDSLDRRIERCAAKYADEIRELMGVGE